MSRGGLNRLRCVLALRWLARLWSAASVILLIGFVVGEGVGPASARDVVGLLLFPLGVAVGMVLGWRREVLGGSITVGSLLAFYALHFATTGGSWPRGWAFLAFAMPGFLYLLAAGLYPRRKTPSTLPAS